MKDFLQEIEGFGFQNNHNSKTNMKGSGRNHGGGTKKVSQ